jgi:hypothetical protein
MNTASPSALVKRRNGRSVFYSRLVESDLLNQRVQIFSVLVALVILAAIIGIAVGVPLSKKNNKNNASGSSSGDSGSSGNGGGSNKPPASPGPDPSVFTKDPNLHQSFYGIAYTPDGSQLPNCGNSLGQ